ncbi:MAG: hypothetical protein EBU66_17015 [Bacteroidetes bacterium]|nr:hypothetical protein [Bacteroidota bacterium]
MTEIIPNLFIASYKEAQKSEPDAYIVNCTKEDPNIPVIGTKGFRIPISDNGNQEEIDELYKRLPDAISKISTMLYKNNKVVVHCLFGQQRSCAVVCAYLISIGYTLDDAIKLIKEKRPCAFFGSINFLDALIRYSADIH